MKTWEKPKLIVLVRNNPQEAVLSVCKGYIDAGMASSGPVEPIYDFNSCQQTPGLAAVLCIECSSVQAS
jgi:hypothetical protein